MPILTIADYLKFANLQMAAEALYGYEAVPTDSNQAPPVLVPGDKRVGPIYIQWLTTGNLHASKFTATITFVIFTRDLAGGKVYALACRVVARPIGWKILEA